jgi:hypothetical protein
MAGMRAPLSHALIPLLLTPSQSHGASLMGKRYRLRINFNRSCKVVSIIVKEIKMNKL